VSPEQARKRFAAARVARLATADLAGRPHLVPVVFAVEQDRVFSVVDAKPKVLMVEVERWSGWAAAG
jgi:nitroimidazol reductase NimA-like FMN-containing flavoprotein (pyridoxamine 5'-phosphate oxidase superfamily)